VTTPDPSPELVGLVDEEGRPSGSAPRDVVRRDNHRHRSTGVLVRRPSDSAVYVHLRSPDKDWAPLHHDAAAGGVLGPDEDPEAGARRELAEELGIEGVELTPLLVAAYDDDTVRYVAHVFEVWYDGPVRHVDGEVVSGEWMSHAGLVERLADPEWAFVPDTRALLDHLAQSATGDWGLLRALRHARRLGVEVEVRRHGRVSSLAEAAAARGVDPSSLVKTLVVRLSDDDHRLVLVPGGRKISWKPLRALWGVNRTSMPDAQAALAVTGYPRGTITPLGATGDLPVVADSLVTGTVSIGGGAHGVGLTVDAEALLAALGATVGDVTEPE
jgi:prolyl-tRNA editing enzyme YbaK/EbsC (Cys-tRNA(Pro) deacylase)/8-oxo-dGTP pyrophosphatase MutT (NUDIX family)